MRIQLPRSLRLVCPESQELWHVLDKVDEICQTVWSLMKNVLEVVLKTNSSFTQCGNSRYYQIQRLDLENIDSEIVFKFELLDLRTISIKDLVSPSHDMINMELINRIPHEGVPFLRLFLKNPRQFLKSENLEQSGQSPLNLLSQTM